jgi:voltage-gated potassium channel
VGRLNKARQLGAYQQWERRTEKPMLIVSLAFLILILVPVVLAPLSPSLRDTLTVIETIFWVIFVIDYIIRFMLAPKRWRFFYTHIPELVVIAVPVLRPLRSLQALRLLRLGGLGSVANRYARRSLQTRSVLLVTAVTAILVITLAGVVLILERGNSGATISTYPEALWWALSTVTTVGYGDLYPITNAGRVTALFLMLAGIALVGIITAAVAAWFVRSVVKAAEPPEPGRLPDQQLFPRLDFLEARVAAIDAGVQRILHLLRADDDSDGARPLDDGFKVAEDQLRLNFEAGQLTQPPEG